MPKSPKRKGKKRVMEAYALVRNGVGILLDLEIDGDGGNPYLCIYTELLSS